MDPDVACPDRDLSRGGAQMGPVTDCLDRNPTVPRKMLQLPTVLYSYAI